MRAATKGNGSAVRVLAAKPVAPHDAKPQEFVERVRTRAHEIFRARTARSVDPCSDWEAAEKELMAALPVCGGDLRANACVGLHDRIRDRAFQLSQERAGDAVSDWLRAEREVLGDLAAVHGSVPSGTHKPAEAVAEARGRARGEPFVASTTD